MNIFKSFCIAISMYSRIPVPHFEWKEKDMKHAIIFFPLIGLLVGAAEYGVYYYFKEWDLPAMAAAIIMCVIPILITGGIHLDGYCDFTDALFSYADKEKRLEIMSDPHIGSFAVMRACLYLIVQTALLANLPSLEAAVCVSCGYVLSRGLSGLAAVTLRSAKSEGSLQSFVKPSHKAAVIVMLSLFIGASGIAMLTYAPDFGGGFAGVLAAVIVFFSCKRKAYKAIGGITGDVCGWFLQKCELWILAAVVIVPVLTDIHFSIG